MYFVELCTYSMFVSNNLQIMRNPRERVRKGKSANKSEHDVNCAFCSSRVGRVSPAPADIFHGSRAPLFWSHTHHDVCHVRLNVFTGKLARLKIKPLGLMQFLVAPAVI